MEFDWNTLRGADHDTAISLLGCGPAASLRQPDLVIAPDGKPYLYRWELIPRNKDANVYFHIQVASDPERPLHDHPWDNFSVILSGGYDEVWNAIPWHENINDQFVRQWRKGDTIFRKAAEAHRLILPKTIPYTMTIFSTGPKVREWGFWYPGGWKHYTDVTRTVGSQSVHVNPEGTNADPEPNQTV